MIRALLLCAAMALGVGCSVQKMVKQPYPDIRRFLIDAPHPSAQREASSVGPTLNLSRWTLSPRFDSRNFVYYEGENRWSSDFYNEFFISPAENFTEEAAEWFRSSDAFGHVTVGTTVTNLTVDVRVVELFGDFSERGSPKANLRVTTVLRRGNETVFRGENGRSIPIESTEAAALVKGWNQALREILGEIEKAVRAQIAQK